MNECPYCGMPLDGGGEQYSICEPCGVIWGEFCMWIEEGEWHCLDDGILLVKGEVAEP